jgi:hypothetical protein
MVRSGKRTKSACGSERRAVWRPSGPSAPGTVAMRPSRQVIWKAPPPGWPPTVGTSWISVASTTFSSGELTVATQSGEVPRHLRCWPPRPNPPGRPSGAWRGASESLSPRWTHGGAHAEAATAAATAHVRSNSCPPRCCADLAMANGGEDASGTAWLAAATADLRTTARWEWLAERLLAQLDLAQATRDGYYREGYAGAMRPWPPPPPPPIAAGARRPLDTLLDTAPPPPSSTRSATTLLDTLRHHPPRHAPITPSAAAQSPLGPGGPSTRSDSDDDSDPLRRGREDLPMRHARSVFAARLRAPGVPSQDPPVAL